MAETHRPWPPAEHLAADEAHQNSQELARLLAIMEARHAVPNRPSAVRLFGQRVLRTTRETIERVMGVEPVDTVDLAEGFVRERAARLVLGAFGRQAVGAFLLRDTWGAISDKTTHALLEQWDATEPEPDTRFRP